MERNWERRPPLLLISHGQNYEKQSFYDISDGCNTTRSISILCDKYVLAFTYGWFVLLDTDRDYCCLWNPVSSKIIELPELKDSTEYSTCILSKPPTEPGCHILFNFASGLKQSFCQIGDDEFVEQSLSLRVMESFNGNIYALVKVGLVTIHFVGKTLKWKPVLKKGKPWNIYRSLSERPWARKVKDYLVESPCNGELLLVRMMRPSFRVLYSYDFKVFRIDIERIKCVEIEDMGEQSIFISGLGRPFSSSSSGGIKPNSIYYTLGGIQGRILYIYDLGNRGTTCFHVLMLDVVLRQEALGLNLVFPWVISDQVIKFL